VTSENRMSTRWTAWGLRPIFGAAGTLLSRRQPAGSGPRLEVSWPDVALLLAVLLAIRLMVPGIAFAPESA